MSATVQHSASPLAQESEHPALPTCPPPSCGSKKERDLGSCPDMAAFYVHYCPVSPCSDVALCRVVPRAVNETSRKVSQYLEKAPIRNTLTVSPPEIGILVYNDDNQWVVWVSKTFDQ